MKTYSGAFHEIKDALSERYGDREAAAIAHELLSELTGLSKIDRLILKDNQLDQLQLNSLAFMLDELQTGKPLQYVTGKAYFLDRVLKVAPGVLIPRPETEELVYWICNTENARKSLRILDIGTGSGCIALALRALLPAAVVTAADISELALDIARENAAAWELPLQFRQTDILDTSHWENLPQYDIIVSNPPYIPQSEAATMHENVTGFEPASALFVPDEDPLRFYRAIARFGRQHLAPGGSLFFELHCDFGMPSKTLIESEGYSEVELRRDMHDNWRMLRAVYKQTE